jgi:acetoin utilization deacetylase AcuC-like enzyme
MLSFKLVYHPGYDLNLGEHVFPSQKYRLVRDRLVAEAFASPEDFVRPEPASDEDILAVHTPDWVHRLKTGTLTFSDILKLEIPYPRPMVEAATPRQMVEAFWLAAGGTMLAARLALVHGVGFNLGGGFHHAFPDHGEGFCAIHDVAVGIRRLQKDGLIRRALVVDCDVHQGNGTAAIFAADPSVFTLSIHQLNNYPAEKPPSDLDINLADKTGDDEYLERLRTVCVPAVAEFHPDLLVYVAGADPYYQDRLGGLSLTLEGLKARDRLVFSCALMHHVPVAVALAGGYAFELNDTVTIHANTARAAKEALDQVGWKRA